MQQLINSAFFKVLFTLIALIIVSAGFCSMSAMAHNESGTDCMIEMNHSSHCADSTQLPSCLNFHLSLMEKFSHGFSDNLGFKFFISLIIFALFAHTTNNLLNVLKRLFKVIKVRFKKLTENAANAFQDIFGSWLSLFEMRDPSHAFVIA